LGAVFKLTSAKENKLNMANQFINGFLLLYSFYL